MKDEKVKVFKHGIGTVEGVCVERNSEGITIKEAGGRHLFLPWWMVVSVDWFPKAEVADQHLIDDKSPGADLLAKAKAWDRYYETAITNRSPRRMAMMQDVLAEEREKMTTKGGDAR